MTLVSADTLRSFTARCFGALDVPEEAAQLVADSLVQADLWGHPSHGVLRTSWYCARLESGATSANAAPEVIVEPPALSVMDGNNGLGQVIANAAMQRAIAAAKRHGIGAVAVRNSGHFGTAMYFTRMAALSGCIGYISTNASPAMAPWGSTEKRVGTNPWSWSAPAGRHTPMMLDIANTAVARGKLYAAKERGEPIPEGWAIDAAGQATTDPAEGIVGTILPMAGHKGYAIAAMVDVLSGLLSGSAFGSAVVGPYVEMGSSGAGHLALAIDIAACRPLDEFEADMERLIEQLKGAPRAEGTAEIFYPGELEARNAEAAERDGIQVPEATLTTLGALGRRLEIEVPF